ncbi:MAG TPA: hypothetical protein VHE61_03815 [Opitutaceae bacterium]|nr:hypothetical protein [Opitutaceae bacterium]
MNGRTNARLAGAAIIACAAGLPLAAAALAGRPLSEVFTFPPLLRIPIGYPRFSIVAAAAVLLPFVGLGAAWWRHAARGRGNARPAPAAMNRTRFPVWGWVAAAWMGIWWALAWTRFTWFEPVQRFTFVPLWVGFIVVVNAVTQARCGGCRMIRTPGRFAGLFLASAFFWWTFEWLNRFSQNWHYLGVADFGPVAYAVHASVSFSTVLPAVASVADLIGTSRKWNSGCVAGLPLVWLNRPLTGVILILIGLAGLAGTGAAPQEFYAALWAAPLALVLGDSILGHREPLASEVARGDWGTAATWAAAALACGFCWEMWNVHSAAKWIYTVPYADRWHVFEMPALGYAGYLPFGIECYFAIARLFGSAWARPFSSVSST